MDTKWIQTHWFQSEVVLTLNSKDWDLRQTQNSKNSNFPFSPQRFRRVFDVKDVPVSFGGDPPFGGDAVFCFLELIANGFERNDAPTLNVVHCALTNQVPEDEVLGN